MNKADTRRQLFRMAAAWTDASRRAWMSCRNLSTCFGEK